jgi:hypothetical protein
VSQPDLVTALQEARLEAPPQLRARVRLMAAADATPPDNRFTWRRALVVVLPAAAAAAAAAAGFLLTRPANEHRSAPPTREGGAASQSLANRPAKASAPGLAPLTVPRAADRAQIYAATLSLQLPSSAAVSDGVKRALRITSSLGGYPTSVHAHTAGKGATADLVLKIPRAHVQAALARLAELGTISAEHVDVQDAQAGLNATDRTIARLQRQLKALRLETPVPTARIDALEARIAALQRREAAVRRTTHYATVSLHLATPRPAAPQAAGHGPLHGVGVALTWLGIGALYALAVGGPVVLLLLVVYLAVRFFRRRRENELLSRS